MHVKRFVSKLTLPWGIRPFATCLRCSLVPGNACRRQLLSIYKVTCRALPRSSQSAAAHWRSGEDSGWDQRRQEAARRRRPEHAINVSILKVTRQLFSLS